MTSNAKDNRIGIYKGAAAAVLAVLLATGTCCSSIDVAMGDEANDVQEGSFSSDNAWLKYELIDHDLTIAALKSLGWPTEYYKDRLEEIAEYKEKLKADGGQEINLQACAEACVIIDEAIEVAKSQLVSLNDNPEALFLGNYFSKEEVFEFCRTGEVPEKANFQVVYFKDDNGEKTNEPGQFFVSNPDGPVFDISVVEEAFDSLDRNYSQCLAGNKVRVLFLTQPKRNGEEITSCTYDAGVIVLCFHNNNPDKFKYYAMKGISVEQYGSCALALGMSLRESALIKGRMAKLCCEYIAGKKRSKTISKLAEFYQNHSDEYFIIFGNGMSISDVDALVEDCKKIMIPFGAENWEEIDAATN